MMKITGKKRRFFFCKDAEQVNWQQQSLTINIEPDQPSIKPLPDQCDSNWQRNQWVIEEEDDKDSSK